MREEREESSSAGVADANRPPSVALLDPGARRSFRESSAAALSASSRAMTYDVANSANASSLIRVPRVVARRASSPRASPPPRKRAVRTTLRG